ncbi:MAG: hypothetical protein KKA54_19900 [Proteobacteria bacterium]|nr:hypothetical protein [Pseudomonadota bacterium]
MEKLIKAALIAWNPFLAVKKRKEEGKLNLEEVIAPFVGVIVASKLVEFEALRYWLEAFSYASGMTIPNIPPFLSSEFAQQFLAVFGTLFPIGAIFLLPKSLFHPHKAGSIGATILIITSSFTFYGSAVAATFNILSGTIVQTNPSMAQNLLYVSMIASFSIIPIAIWLWGKILLRVLGLSKPAFASITISYILGILILAMLLGLGASGI